MKRISIILLATVTTLTALCFTFIAKDKKHFFAAGHFYNKNYIPAHTPPGEALKQPQFSPGDLLDFTIDGKMEEESWLESQIINSFYTNGRARDKDVEVNVISDKENIYLFWKVSVTSPVTANISKNDSVLSDDDYVSKP